MGDASNLVSIIAGELLQKAENLLRMGLHPSDIVQGYEVASTKALEILEGMAKLFELTTARLFNLYFLLIQTVTTNCDRRLALTLIFFLLFCSFPF